MTPRSRSNTDSSRPAPAPAPARADGRPLTVEGRSRRFRSGRMRGRGSRGRLRRTTVVGEGVESCAGRGRSGRQGGHQRYQLQEDLVKRQKNSPPPSSPGPKFKLTSLRSNACRVPSIAGVRATLNRQQEERGQSGGAHVKEIGKGETCDLAHRTQGRGGSR